MMGTARMMSPDSFGLVTISMIRPPISSRILRNAIDALAPTID